MERFCPKGTPSATVAALVSPHNLLPHRPPARNVGQPCGRELLFAVVAELPSLGPKRRHHRKPSRIAHSFFRGKDKKPKKGEQPERLSAKKAPQPGKKGKSRKRWWLFGALLVAIVVGLVFGEDILELIEDILHELF